MRQLELSDFDSRELLSAYLEGVLSRYEKEKVKAVLSYDMEKECFLEFPGTISFEDTMLSPEGYALIFEDGSCLYLRMIAESKVRIGTFELSETDRKTIALFSRKDFLNVSEFVYGQGRYRLWMEYSFRYARMRNAKLEEGIVPDSFTSVTIRLTNRKKLIFRSAMINDKLYTELLPVKLKVSVSRQRSGRKEHDQVRRYLEKRHRD